MPGPYNFGYLPSTRLATLSSSLSHLPLCVSSTVNTCKTTSELLLTWEAVRSSSAYFKEDAPVICCNICFFPCQHPSTLSWLHKRIPCSHTKKEKKSIPLTLSLLGNKGGIKTLAVLLDVAKTVAEPHPMARYFQSSLFLPTSALPPQKGSRPCSLQVRQRNTEPATPQWKRICDGRTAAATFRVSACQCGFEWAVVLIFPPFLSTLLREAEEPSGTEVRVESKVLRPHLAEQGARSRFFPCAQQRQLRLTAGCFFVPE